MAGTLGNGATGCADDGAPPRIDTDGAMSETTAGSTGLPAREPCEGATQLLYDPFAGALHAYPDDVFTVDADTPTGVRLDLRLGENVQAPGLASAFTSVYVQASTLDGFGTTSGAYLRTTAPLLRDSLPEIDGVAEPSDSLLLVDLEAQPPALVPVVWEQVPEDPDALETTLVIEPVVPLEPATRYGLALTTAATDLQGGCIAPSETMRLLLGPDPAPPEMARTRERVAGLVGALVDLGAVTFAEELSVAVVFTTQTTTDQSVGIAQEIRATTPPGFVADGACEDAADSSPYLSCEGRFDLLDFTDAQEHVRDDLQAAGGYEVPISIYLPKTGAAPWPTILYGHGLGGSREQAAVLAGFVAEEGYAVVAIDAPKHGDHPDAGGDNAVLDFFALTVTIVDPLDAFALRDNFRQGAYDKLQVVEAIRAGVDADEDGTVDLDIERLHYLGVSLGGIMGAELVALAPDVATATMIVPGARVTGIVQDGASFAGVLTTFAAAATDGEIARFFPLVQGVIDRGDAGVYARHLLPGRRLPGFDAAAPQVLMQMVIGDDTVPNSSNGFYARALGAPLLGERRLAVGLELQPDLPTAGNIDPDHTAGVFQFDELETGVMASHGNVATSEVAQHQIRRFVLSWDADAVSQIVDPYAELGLD